MQPQELDGLECCEKPELPASTVMRKAELDGGATAHAQELDSSVVPAYSVRDLPWDGDKAAENDGKSPHGVAVEVVEIYTRTPQMKKAIHVAESPDISTHNAEPQIAVNPFKHYEIPQDTGTVGTEISANGTERQRSWRGCRGGAEVGF